MKYLVFYRVRITTGYYRNKGDYHGTDVETDIPTWREFDDKKPAIEYARDNRGVIVEAFEFDIKKKVSNE